MAITSEQKAFYDAFGFLVVRQLFSAAEMEELSRTFDAMLTAERQGAPFPGTKRQSLYAIAEKSDRVFGLMFNQRTIGAHQKLTDKSTREIHGETHATL